MKGGKAGPCVGKTHEVTLFTFEAGQAGRGCFLLTQLFLFPSLHSFSFSAVQSQSRQSAKLFLQSSELELPYPLVRGGEHTRLRERGWGESQFQRGTYTVVLFLYKSTLWVQYTVLTLSRTVRATIHMRKLARCFPKKCRIHFFCLIIMLRFVRKSYNIIFRPWYYNTDYINTIRGRVTR